MEFQPSGSPALSPASTPKGLRQSKQQTDSSCNHTMPNAKFRDNTNYDSNPPKNESKKNLSPVILRIIFSVS